MTFTRSPTPVGTKALLNPRIQGGVIPTVFNFRQLRELELGGDWPKVTHTVLLSSITSIELRRLIFPSKYLGDPEIFAQQMVEWNPIDEELCGLVGRLRATGYRYNLEVELRLTTTGNDLGKYDFTKFLPKFRERGVVTVAYYNHLLHSSVHGC